MSTAQRRRDEPASREPAGAAHVDLLAVDSALYEESVIRFLRRWLETTGDSTAEGGE
jgi:hypothetical protein